MKSKVCRLYLYDERSHVLLLQHGRTVRTAISESWRVVVDVLNVKHDHAATCFACSTAAAAAVVGRRHVECVRDT